MPQFRYSQAFKDEVLRLYASGKTMAPILYELESKFSADVFHMRHTQLPLALVRYWQGRSTQALRKQTAKFNQSDEQIELILEDPYDVLVETTLPNVYKNMHAQYQKIVDERNRLDKICDVYEAKLKALATAIATLKQCQTEGVENEQAESGSNQQSKAG